MKRSNVKAGASAPANRTDTDRPVGRTFHFMLPDAGYLQRVETAINEVVPDCQRLSDLHLTETVQYPIMAEARFLFTVREAQAAMTRILKLCDRKVSIAW